MKYTAYGAAGEVTGSRHLIEFEQGKILLDCGLFQGNGSRNRSDNKSLPFDAKSISAVILSHAHIDHSGCLPLLYKSGYRGPIFMTSATRDVVELMLLDTAHVQRQEYEFALAHPEGGVGPTHPLYDENDVQAVLQQARILEYGACEQILPQASLCFMNSGHILGSSITQLEFNLNRLIRFCYTGDLGKQHLPIIDRPVPPKAADILLTESTYGDSEHDDLAATEQTMVQVVNETVKRGGKVFVPAFALGRMQSIIYILHRLMDEKKIPRVRVYVDSPLGTNLTDVFTRHTECFDEETRSKFLAKNDPPFKFSQLEYIASVNDSKKLNNQTGPFIVVASSGMLEGGRILFHLMNGIDDERNTIFVVGYMADGTLGRELVDGAKMINIFHRRLPVKAKIVKLNALSAHADKNELYSYMASIADLKKVLLVHGEENVRRELSVFLRQSLPKVEVMLPQYGQGIELS